MCCRRRDRRQSTVHRTVETHFQIPPSRTIKKDHILKDVVLFMYLLNIIDAIENTASKYVHPSTSLWDAAGCIWIFPRPKKMPLAYFLPLRSRGRPIQIPPSRHIKKDHTLKDVVIFMAEKEGFELLVPCPILTF